MNLFKDFATGAMYLLALLVINSALSFLNLKTDLLNQTTISVISWSLIIVTYYFAGRGIRSLWKR